jgi:uncharacterized membrane protein
MISHLLHLKERVLATYWFLPSILLVAGGLLAIGFIEIDRRLDAEIFLRFAGEVYRHGVDGSRLILSLGAGAMATIAFSIVIVALQLASSQYGPRVLKSFFKDRAIQCVLGSFLGAIAS